MLLVKAGARRETEARKERCGGERKPEHEETIGLRQSNVAFYSSAGAVQAVTHKDPPGQGEATG
jgi:hypothetical protein